MTVMRRGPALTRMRTLEAATPVCVAMPHRSRASPARLWMILEGAAAAAAAAASRTRKRRRCEASGRGKLPSDRARRVPGPGTGTRRVCVSQCIDENGVRASRKRTETISSVSFFRNEIGFGNGTGIYGCTK